MRNHLSDSDFEKENSFFCHLRVELLVRAGILTADIAATISLDQYEHSALSDLLIFGLVYDKMISVDLALTTKKEAVAASALSNLRIRHLVSIGEIPAKHALLMPKEEVEDPLHYLQNKLDKTPEQMRKLALYENDSNISSEYVELIVLLEFNPHRTPSENRKLELLLNEDTRCYAVIITALEFYLPHTEKNLRELDLLYNRYARDYATDIVDLEFLETETTNQSLMLESLYLKVCCKIPYESLKQRILKNALEEEGIIQPNYLPRGCGVEMQLGPAVPFGLAEFGIFSTNYRALMERMKSLIDRVIKKKIISCYFAVNNVPTMLRNTEHMQSYVNNKIDLLRYGILKYFTGSTAPEFSEHNLHVLIETLCEKIIEKKLFLNENDKIMDLKTFLQMENQSLPQISIAI